jgi:hypothetical protein
MDWNDWQTILRWRAVEEGDADGALLSEERRREATVRTCAGMTADEVKTDPLGQREAAFLLRRARWLEEEVIGCNGTLVRLMERLSTISGRSFVTTLGWVAAAITGYILAGLGQQAEFNLLALPLVGLMLWNAAVMLWSLVMEMRQGQDSSLLIWLAQRLSFAGLDRPTAEPGEPITGISVDQRFTMLAQGPAGERWQRRFRAWLHLAAALMALGSIVGLYARGWAHEYRAVWESTILSEETAQHFLGALFRPASALLGVEIPLQELPAMHRTGGLAQQPSPALPWLHLYAGSLLVLVVLPRLALAGFTIWRAHAMLARRMRKLGWHNYLLHTLQAAEGGHETVTVLVHGSHGTPAHQEVWARGVRERFGQMIQPEFAVIPHGEEDDFTANWKPRQPHAALVFNLATTPEAEVQRRLVLEINRALQATQQSAELLVLLDATSIGNRWSPEKWAGREKLWIDMLSGIGVQILVAAQRSRS